MEESVGHRAPVEERIEEWKQDGMVHRNHTGMVRLLDTMLALWVEGECRSYGLVQM